LHHSSVSPTIFVLDAGKILVYSSIAAWRSSAIEGVDTATLTAATLRAGEEGETTLAETDAGTLAGSDVGTDAVTLAGTEAGTLVGTDAGILAGTEVGIDVGELAGTEAVAETGTLVGIDAERLAGAVFSNPCKSEIALLFS
jgi:hypothetical protein